MNARPSHAKKGFTLLELLLAVSLSVVLLAATFANLEQYFSLEQRSFSQVRETQTALAIARDIQSDIELVAHVFLNSNLQSKCGPEGLRSNWVSSPGLVERQLHTGSFVETPVVLVGNHSELLVTTAGANARFETDEPLQSRPFAQVIWCCGDRAGIRIANEKREGLPQESFLPFPRKTSGLVRCATPISVRGAQRASQRPTSLHEFDRVFDRLEFRYFDGIEWTSQWNSAIEDGLPKAVAVRIGRTETLTHYRMVIPLMSRALSEATDCQ